VRHETGARPRRTVASVQRRTSRGRRGSVREPAGRNVAKNRSIWNHRKRGCQRERCSGRGDDDIRAHNTLFAESNEVQVFYPFHPLHGSTLQILRRPKRGDGAVCVIDRVGKRLKIPVWMLLPDCTAIKISDEVHLSKESLLSLMLLLSPHAPEDRDHDNLLPTAVDGCKGGRRGATKAAGSDDPGRERNRADECDDARRSDRSDGSHSDGGLSGRRRKR
jgi:hypothetical protein